MTKKARELPYKSTRSLSQLECNLLPAIEMAQGLFMALSNGAPLPRYDGGFLESVFLDYRYYLGQQWNEIKSTGEVPSERYMEYDKLIVALLGCLEKLNPFNTVPKPDAKRVYVFLRDLPSETLLFN